MQRLRAGPPAPSPGCRPRYKAAARPGRACGAAAAPGEAVRSGAEQSGSMVSVWGAPRSRAARAGLPRGVRAVAGGVPHWARPPCPCRGSSCPQLLRAPRRAPAPPSTPCSPGSCWARCGEPRVLAEPLTAPPPPSSDSPWSHGVPALRPGCRAQAATPQLWDPAPASPPALPLWCQRRACGVPRCPACCPRLFGEGRQSEEPCPVSSFSWPPQGAYSSVGVGCTLLPGSWSFLPVGSL